MNEAWISARAGCAVVVTDSDYFLLEAGRQAPPKPCPAGQLNNLRLLASDIVRMESGAFPFPDVKQVLEKAWEERSALDLTLMSLDADLSQGLREEAARVASQLMETQEVREAVHRRFLGVPLPEEADVEGGSFEGVVAELVREAAENRELVAIATRAWDQIFWEHFTYRALQTLKEVCIVEGGFAALVCTLSTGDESCFQRWLKILKGALADSEVKDWLLEWRRMASQLYKEARTDLLCDRVGLRGEAGETLRDSLESVELEKLPIKLDTLSLKALGGVAAHFLTIHEVSKQRARQGEPSRRAISLREKLLDRIGVGRTRQQPPNRASSSYHSNGL